MIYKNFNVAYIKNLHDVYMFPQFIDYSPHGFIKSRERLNSTFALENPRERVCYLPSRKTNIIFNFAEVLWYFKGDNKLDFISYYAPNIKKNSMDGKTLTGTAYGPKIFAFGPNKIDQWSRIFKLLAHENLESKRTFIQIFDPNENLEKSNIDVSCTIGIQFIVRTNKLHVISTMRANDAYRGIISDVFAFTFIQEFLATQLGVELGIYYHNVGSMHIRKSDDKMVKQIIDSIQLDPLLNEDLSTFPAMPTQNNWKYLPILFKYEEILRKHEQSLKLNELEALNIPSYWEQIILLFEIYREIFYEKKINLEIYKHLYPIYQNFVSNKWSLNQT